MKVGDLLHVKGVEQTMAPNCREFVS